MLRDIVRIDEERCTGCGLCVDACEEGAIQMVRGKARLVREDHCDGLGKCLPECPAGAIFIERREAAAFTDPLGSGTDACPGIPMAGRGPGGPHIIRRTEEVPAPGDPAPSRLSQWPVQLALIPVASPSFDGCDLLVAADCCAYALGSFHEDFIKDRTTVIGCPKLDPVEPWKKLDDILALHDVKSITVTRMEVPCCNAASTRVGDAVRRSGKDVPLRVVTISSEGRIIDEKHLRSPQRGGTREKR